MKRKVIQLAGKTLLVSLPSKWASNYNVKKGQEIEVEEDHNRIIITSGSMQHSSRKEIDVSGLVGLANRLVGAIYKAGYDELRIQFSSCEELKEIQSTLKRTCLGYEIVEQTDRSITIKEISKPEVGQFSIILRRLFIFLSQISIDSLAALKKGDKNALNAIVLRDDTVNRYADFCRRILFRDGYEKIQKTPAIFYIVEELEKIGDIYRDICKSYVEEPIMLDEKIEKIFTAINSLLKTFEELFYKYDHEKLNDFVKSRNRIRNELNKAFSSTKGKNAQLIFHLNNLLERIFDLNGALMLVHE